MQAACDVVTIQHFSIHTKNKSKKMEMEEV